MYVGTNGMLNTLLLIKRELSKSLTKENRKYLKTVNNKIHEEKLGLRNRNRELERYAEIWKWKQYGHEYNDRVWAKYVIPRELTETEINEFIEEEWCNWYNPYGDGRDCTGVWFTSRIKCFVCDGKTIAYHFKCCDV